MDYEIMELSHIFIVVGAAVVSLLALWSSERHRASSRRQKVRLRRHKRRNR